jgi:hypothetical protein
MRVPAPLVLSALLVLAGTGNAGADYRESYRKGLEAMEKGNWPETLRRMREAAAEQPFEGERVKIYGVRFEDYLPHFYVGLALFNARDCEGAIKAWQTSEGQGKVKKTPQYKTLVKEKQTCETRIAQGGPPSPPPVAKPAGPDPAQVAQAVQRVEAQLQVAGEAARAVAAMSREPALAGGWAGDPNLGGAEREGANLLAAARSKLEAGRRDSDLAALAQAGELASRATLQLETTRQVATVRREAARMQAPKRPTEDATPSMTVPGREAPPPPELVTGAFLYFSGQYEAAIKALSELSRPSGRAGAQALLLRAAAHHALYLIGRETDPALLDAARRDALACRRLDPRFAPHPQYFSPRFREFFDAAR